MIRPSPQPQPLRHPPRLTWPAGTLSHNALSPLTHQTVAVPAGRAPAQITTRQLIELFFSSQAGGHCKNIPTLEYGFLVQVPDTRRPLLHAWHHPFPRRPAARLAVCAWAVRCPELLSRDSSRTLSSDERSGARVEVSMRVWCDVSRDRPRVTVWVSINTSNMSHVHDDVMSYDTYNTTHI